MDAQTIAHYTGLPLDTVEVYFELSPEEIYQDEAYHEALNSLDRKTLDATLPGVRRVYDRHMDDFAAYLYEHHQVERGTMSSHTLGNWVLGFIQQPEYIVNILQHHQLMPGAAFADGLEQLLDLLESVPAGKQEWQQALCLMAFPMMMK